MAQQKQQQPQQVMVLIVVKHIPRGCRWAKTTVTCRVIYLELTLLQAAVPNLTRRTSRTIYLIVPKSG